MSLRIVDISIQDTFGTRVARIKPKSVTRIKGPNGSGKSSILRAVGRVFEGGSDPSVIRHGAEKSVVELFLEDGTKITRTCAPVKRRRGADPNLPVEYNTLLEILQPDGTPRRAPQTYINELADALAVDPGKILGINASTVPGRKALAEILLKIMPIRFEPAEIAAKLSADYRDGSEVAKLDTNGLALPAITGPLDLDGLKKYALTVTDQRRRVGQTRDDADGAVNRGRATLPEDDSANYAADLVVAEREEKALREEIAGDKLKIERIKGEVIAEAVAANTKECSAIDAEIDAEIKRLNEQRATRKGAATQTLHTAKTDILTQESDALAALEERTAPKLRQAAFDIATLRERVAGQARAKFVREQIEENLETYRTAARKYDQLTEVLARLEAIRKDKLDSLPVAGLEVMGDEVRIDGTPWQNVNTARRVEVAVQLCTLLGGPGPIFLDDAEHLDAETRSWLERGLTDAGYQLFEAIVSDIDGLTIETFDPVAA